MTKEQKPILHGVDHSPWGADPGKPGPWVTVGSIDGPPFVTGSNASPTIDSPTPVPLRFRIVLGPPNIVRDGAITEYIWHQLEIQGDVTGVSAGDIVFVIPPAFRLEYDIPCHTHDDSGLYVPCRLLATGEFLYGVP